MAIYLVRCTDIDRASAHLGDRAEVVALEPGLGLASTDLTRSRLYHEVKWSQAEGSPTLVARLVEAPKFAHMAPGTTAWVRRHLP